MSTGTDSYGLRKRKIEANQLKLIRPRKLAKDETTLRRIASLSQSFAASSGKFNAAPLVDYI